VQPVHSWNDSQMTDGRRAAASASATWPTADGGNAIRDAVAEQNLRKPRRDTPWASKYSPSV
jgi:hypothetical protein